MHEGIKSAAAVLSSVMLAGCAAKGLEPRTVQGECVAVFGGNVCSWATLDASGGVVEFGATVPVASIEGAPHDAAMAWPPVANAIVPMPAELTAATGVDHLTVFWEPHGHPPGAYLTPHFDFHFYSVSSDSRGAIDCADATKPAALPANYGMVDVEIPELGTLVGLCVPQMGMHSLLASELESAEVFTGTMVVGYYGGAPVFFEPMISREMLMRRQSFDLAMPTVSGLPEGVRYPRRFRADFDATADTYRFVFSGI
jgi:hypothetical protein